MARYYKPLGERALNTPDILRAACDYLARRAA